jgi:hypothetical protein
MSHMMDYLVKGGDEVALLKAQLEHMGGALGREIELGQEARAEIERLRTGRVPVVEIEAWIAELGALVDAMGCSFSYGEGYKGGLVAIMAKMDGWKRAHEQCEPEGK